MHDPASSTRTTRSRWKAYGIAALSILTTTAVIRWQTHETVRGGSFPVTVADPAGYDGTYYGLYYRQGVADDASGIIDVLTSGRRVLPPRGPVEALPRRPDGTPGETNSAAAAAWVAANRITGNIVDYTATRRVAAQQTTDISALGIDVNDPVELDGAERIVGTGDQRTRIPIATPLDDYVHYQTRQQPLISSPDSVNGLSVGLIYALAYLDHITAGDLTGGRVIAASGTISPRGHIGLVIGLDVKAQAALRAGVEVLFVPAGTTAPDIERIREITGTKLQVVEVETLDEVVTWLCANGADSELCTSPR